jgi:hypothetical protein
MSSQFHRVGTLRAALIVLGGAIVAVLALSLSGLSVAATEGPVATVSPHVDAPAAVPPGPAPRRPLRHSRVTAQPKRKRCRPVDGLTFTVSASARCPRPLKTAHLPHLSARLRKVASRRRPTATAEPAPTTRATTKTAKPAPTTTAITKTAKPAPTTTTTTKTAKPAPTTIQRPVKSPTATQPSTTPGAQPNATPPLTGGTPAGSHTVEPRPGASAPND